MGLKYASKEAKQGCLQISSTEGNHSHWWHRTQYSHPHLGPFHGPHAKFPVDYEGCCSYFVGRKCDDVRRVTAQQWRIQEPGLDPSYLGGWSRKVVSPLSNGCSVSSICLYVILFWVSGFILMCIWVCACETRGFWNHRWFVSHPAWVLGSEFRPSQNSTCS